MISKIQVRAAGARRAEVLIHEYIGENWYGDGLTAKRFARELAALGAVDEILVRINSPGGAVFDGIGIYNTLKAHGATIEVFVEGLAASIASVIAMAGDKIRVGHGAMFMIHNPWTIAMGDADDMRDVADMLDKVGESLLDIYQTRTGLAGSEIKTIMDAETWLTAADAVEKGFADEVDTDAAAPDENTGATYRERVAALATKFRQPADAHSLRAVAAVIQSATADIERNRSLIMTPEEIAAAAAADQAKKLASQNQAAAAAALAADSLRRTNIRAAFGKFADAHRALLDTCLDDTACTADTAKERLLAKLGEGVTAIAAGGANIAAGKDEREKFAAGAERALLARAGLEKVEAGNEFNGQNLPDLAIACLKRSGIVVAGLSRNQVALKVFASMSTSDFPQLLSNIAGKVLRKAYGAFPNTWSKWAAAGSVSDFKVHPRIQMGSFDNLAVIPEGGEYSYGALAEDYENAQAATRGKAIRFTRQMLVNDDLGGFLKRAQILGRAAARTINSDAYAFLTSGASNHGPTSTDTGQYFNATAITTAGGHANLTSSGTAISVDSIGVGRVAMRKQKDKGLKVTLNIEPAVLLCPVGKEDLANQIVKSRTKDGQSNPEVINVHQNRLEVVSDPALDAVSATAWYEFANPLDAAGFEVVFLDGVQEPFIDEMIEFETDALALKTRLDYGTALGDWRGSYKNAGA